MKVHAAGGPPRAGSCRLNPDEATSYVLRLRGVTTRFIGCSSPAEVGDDARIARASRPFDEPAMRAMEECTGPRAGFFTSYKNQAWVCVKADEHVVGCDRELPGKIGRVTIILLLSGLRVAIMKPVGEAL